MVTENFNWSENRSEVPGNFYKTNYNDRRWAKVKVPGDWQREGFGKAIYLNVSFLFILDILQTDLL